MYVTYHPLKECVELPDSFLSAIQTFSSSQFYTELLNLLSGVNSEYFYSTVTERYSKISLVPSYSPTFSIKSTYFDVFNFNTQELNKINHILETAAIFHSLLEKCTSTDTNLRDALAELFNDSISQYCLKEYIDALPKDPSLQELFEFSLIWRNRIDYFSHVYTTLYSELGLNILNNLYKEYTSKIETLWESQILKKILNSLFSRFFLQLKEWLLYGRIPNHNKDWIFCKREEIPDCRKWKELIYPKMKLFPISMKYIVNIFEDFLSIGKAQLFLQESNYQTKFKDNVNKMNDLLNEISDPTVFYEIRHRYHLCCTIRKMHDIANRYIIQQIFQDEHLMDHWKAIKSYMLLTDININKKIMNNIDNCIELTVDQIIFNFSKLVNSCDMIRKLRIKPSFNLYTYTNPHASQRNTSAFLIPNLNFITMEPLSVNFSSSLPISIIINEKTLNYLQKIFKLTLSLLAVYTSFEKIYSDIKEAFSCVRKFNNPQLENFPLYRLLIHFKRAEDSQKAELFYVSIVFASLIFFRTTLYSLRWLFFRGHFFRRIITKSSRKQIISKNELHPYFSNVPISKRWRTTNEIVSLLHSVLCGFCTLYVFVEGYESLSDYQYGFSYTGAALCMMSFGYFLSDMIDTIINERSAFKVFELIFHHLLSSIGCFLPFVSGKYMQLVLMGLIMELNSIFLHIRILMIYKSVDKKKMAFKVVSILTVITFIIFRIVPSTYLVTIYIYHFSVGRKETVLGILVIFLIVFGLFISNIVMFIRLIKTDYFKKNGNTFIEEGKTIIEEKTGESQKSKESLTKSQGVKTITKL
uniref:TLC domain-containing protein n=1 Tax=Parastrongyloides trichosuri TaxID=131310 RepID=A0A0N4ZEX4_PARTI